MQLNVGEEPTFRHANYLSISELLYFLRYELLSSLIFGPVTDGQADRRMQSDAYEPNMPKCRCAQRGLVHVLALKQTFN